MGLQNNGSGLVLDINVLNGLVKVGVDLTTFSVGGMKGFLKKLAPSQDSSSDPDEKPIIHV